ncbi:MAG: UDP-N-acetylmuramoyl-tripeptide--D-alanyl-D-alanine ligase [Candidatus Sericytochromatia bacterium]|nr:UDP-N-acetylmuramoyl-tripeptide--D-alanyl-D-alanine ligase [Candidatus Sericytochromatia bacterium]
MIAHHEVLEATGATLIGPLPQESFGEVVTDSRRPCPGSLFVALSGPRFDGHDFIPAATTHGAKAVLVSDPTAVPPDVTGYVVPDPLRAYGHIARALRRREGWKIVAVTGSSGKTTTKELIADLLARNAQVVRSPENHNNEVGVPKTLLAVREPTDIVVLEMGMRGRGQIAWLCEVAEPDIAVITTVGQAHIDLLGSQEAIMEAKGEVLAGLKARGQGIVNGDDPWLARLAERHPATWQTSPSGRPEAVIRATGAPAPTEAGWVFPMEWHLPDGRRGTSAVRMHLPGRHHVANALAAAGALLAAGHHLPSRLDLPALGVGGRGRVLSADGVDVVDESYNANPESVRASLETFCATPALKRRIAVLGGMAELGAHAGPAWQALAAWLASAPVDLIVAVGEGPHALADHPGLRVLRCKDSGEAVACLQGLLAPGDRVLIKGSRAARLDEVVAGLALQREEHA